MTAAESGDVAGRPVRGAEALAVGGAEADSVATRAAAGDWETDCEVVALYTTHYRPLVRLAVLLVRDVATAEEIVQDSFVAMHAHGRRLKDSGKTTAYLRRCVVNRSCSVLRHRKVAERNMLQPPPEMPSAEQEAVALLERSAVVAALHGLAPRQREAIARGITRICPRLRSLRRWESAGALSRATSPGLCRRCAMCWACEA